MPIYALRPLVPQPSTATPGVLATGNHYVVTAAAGAVTVQLPALTAVPLDGDQIMVEKDFQDGTTNPITVACAAGDTYESGAATSTLATFGERVRLQAATVSGVRVWKVVDRSMHPAATQAALDGKAPTSAGVPLGGGTGQVLRKLSGTDRDVVWSDAPGGRGVRSKASNPTNAASGSSANVILTTFDFNDDASNYSLSAGSLIVARAGLYLLNYSATVNCSATYSLYLQANGTTVQEGAGVAGQPFSVVTLARLAANTTLTLRIYGNAASTVSSSAQLNLALLGI